MRFPRTVRFDISDTRIYEIAAAPDEWAVSGAFAFAGADPATLVGKTRQAFVHGFLGTASFGWSTFVAVAEISDAEFEEVVRTLAGHAVDRYGAPDLEAALPAAREEAAFAAGLCDHKVNTLLCVERDLGEEGIVERFRVVEPTREPAHARIWTIVEDDGSV
jgi:hypothetical protein